MCGIVAIISKKKKKIEYACLKMMADTLEHRGPDDEGCLIEDHVALFHKRLSIIDLVSGQQPMTSGNVSIVFNGEIYNYIELRQTLMRKGHSFRTNSDTEVILQLYEERGEECVKYLNGMFAFLLYDRNKNKVVVARDRFGIKPMYYYQDENWLFYASEIKAIVKHPDVPSKPNFNSIQEYIVFQYVLNSDTFFENIHKLLPSHYQTIDLATNIISTTKYWEPDFTVDTHHTEEFFIQMIRTVLEDTIKIQLRSDVPVGTHLSGGMDSSIVTMLASKYYSDSLKTFTGAFREGEHYDETAYAREVAKSCGAETYEIYPTEKEFIDILPKLIYYMDEPAAGPGIFPQYMVSKLASENVKVVLGGQGGDEIFGGYTRFVIAYLEQAIKGSIYENNEEGEHLVSLKSILPNLPALKRYSPMLKRFWRSGLFGPMDLRYFNLINRSEGNLRCLAKEFRENFNSERIISRYKEGFNNPKTLSYYNKMVNYDMVNSLPALLQVEDRVSMAVSLESRVPILDHRLVDIVTRMPPAMKFKGAEMKYILKKSTQGILPSVILNRKDKMGFPVPLQSWSQNLAGIFFKDVLLSSSCRNRGLFDLDQIEKLIANEDAFSRQLWGLLNIELWFQTFID